MAGKTGTGAGWLKSHAEKAHARAEEFRAIQREAEALRRKRSEEQKKHEKEADRPIQPRDRKEPEPPMPAQHLAKPGREAELEVRPRYQAPTYRGADRLKGMTALITGGDSGIGRAVAVLYAREGADVAIVYLEEEEDAEETKRAVEAEGRRCILISGDVGDSSFCDTVVEHVVSEFDKLDILVNNAAFQTSELSIEDITDRQLETTFRTNVFGYFFMARAALRHMKDGAVILNTSSVTGDQGHKELLDYSATKGAINAFTKSLSQQVISRGIRVNAIAPGPVWTPLNPSDSEPDEVKSFGQGVPMKRPAQPEEIAPAYVFLAAPSESSYITGDILPIYGGTPT